MLIELLARRVQQRMWPRLARMRNTQCFTAVIFFEPIAVESLGVFNFSTNSLLKEIGLRISLNTGDPREASFLYQCISVLVQRFDVILLHDSLPIVDCAD